MQRSNYAPEFKDEAVKQVIDKGHSVVDVAKRLGIPDNVLCTWVNKFKKADQPESSDLKAMQAEVAKLKAELRLIHSDQGSQFGSDEFTRWCKDNRLSPSMSRRGNC
jgi:transposase